LRAGVRAESSADSTVAWRAARMADNLVAMLESALVACSVAWKAWRWAGPRVEPKVVSRDEPMAD
jgi:hypothetical protein